MSFSAGYLRREYEKLKKNGFPISETFEYGAKLGKSAEIELHFELYLEDQKNPRSQRWHPEDFFRYHSDNGIMYLRQQLGSDNKDSAVNAAYLLAELLPRGRYTDQDRITGELNKALVLFAESESAEYRRKSIIALGWVGTENEIPTLKKHLLSDPDTLCRAWSASSFLQMSGRVPPDIIKKEASGVLTECLERETDVFVRGVAVEAVQCVWNVKLGLRGSAVEARNQKAVNRAARRALELLAPEN
ncbi:MAG: HEAT repeat domain-containing protein [Eubacteriales bacterium]